MIVQVISKEFRNDSNLFLFIKISNLRFRSSSSSGFCIIFKEFQRMPFQDKSGYNQSKYGQYTSSKLEFKFKLKVFVFVFFEERTFCELMHFISHWS